MRVLLQMPLQLSLQNAFLCRVTYLLDHVETSLLYSIVISI